MTNASTAGRLAKLAAAAAILAVAALLVLASRGGTERAGAATAATAATVTIKIGTEAFYPPFESFASNNKTIVGLDPDLGAALGRALNARVTFTHTAFDGLLPALSSGRFDVVMAAITDTKERQRTFDFVDYFRSGQGIIVKKGNPEDIHGVRDLCGKKVAVLKASVQQELLEGYNRRMCSSSKITIIALPSDKDALVQIQSGRADASLTQDAVARYNTSTGPAARQFEVANARPIAPTPLGIVFKKGSPWRDRFRTALVRLQRNGTYDRILRKYNLQSGAYKPPTINAGK
jgi:polar amino acid transport system substrate-binding protein